MSLNDNNDRISMMSNIPNVMLRNGQMLDIKYNWGLIFRIWEYIISQKKKKKKKKKKSNIQSSIIVTKVSRELLLFT